MTRILFTVRGELVEPRSQRTAPFDKLRTNGRDIEVQSILRSAMACVSGCEV